MRNSILKLLLILPLAAIATYSGDCSSAQPNDSFVFSSEDSFGGGSYLGVDTRDVTPDRLEPLQLKEEHGVEVTMVDQDAPAGKAGLKEHDVILSVNGQSVESVEQLRRMIREVPAGRVVSLGISRDGKPLTVQAQLAARKNFAPEGKFNFVIPPIPPVPPMPEIDVPVSIVVVHSSARSGLMVENLTPQLADFFGAKEGHGVLVRSVEKGSRAEKAGFHAGDVIVKVNGESIHDSGDFTHALRGGNHNTVNVGIIRDKKEQTITLALPDRKESDLFEESFDLPEIDAEARDAMIEANAEIAQVGPEMELATQEIQRVKPELEEQIQDLCKQQADIKKQIKDQMQIIRRDLPRQLKEWKYEFRQLRITPADI